MDCEAHSSARASHHYIRILALPASQKSKHRFWGSTSKTLRTSPLTPDSRLCVCFVYVSLLRQPGLHCFSDVFSWGFLGRGNREVKIAFRRKRFLARQRWFLKMNADGSWHGQSARRLKCTTCGLEVGLHWCMKMIHALPHTYLVSCCVVMFRVVLLRVVLHKLQCKYVLSNYFMFS